MFVISCFLTIALAISFDLKVHDSKPHLRLVDGLSSFTISSGLKYRTITIQFGESKTQLKMVVDSTIGETMLGVYGCTGCAAPVYDYRNAVTTNTNSAHWVPVANSNSDLIYAAIGTLSS